MRAGWWILISSLLGCSGGGSTAQSPQISAGTAAVSGSAGASGAARPTQTSSVTPSAGHGGQAAQPAARSSATAGVAGRATLPAADSSAAGSGAAAGRDSQAGQGVAGAAGAAGSAGAAAAPNTGVLPAVVDLQKPGPFKSQIVSGTGPNNGYRLDHPDPFAGDGVLHPVVVFAAGGGFPENYETMLRYFSSHGFVVLTYAATSDDGQGVIDGIDWLVVQGEAASGKLSGKIDTEHIAAAGHSFGSLAVFNAAPDPRITTTIHLQGGTLDPHKEVANLRAPALFVCGESPMGDQDGTFTGDMANPNCAIDFELATTPVFYGSLKGAAHIQLTESVPDPDDALRSQMLGAIGGWLRWRLAGDQTQRARYLSPDCELCQPNTGWTIMQKGLM